MDRPAYSMTGAGFAAGATEVGELRVEVRAVNGRGLTVKLRLASPAAAYELAIDALVRERVRRGTIAVIVERQSGERTVGERQSQLGSFPSAGLPDRNLLRGLAEELRQLATELQLPSPSLAEIVQIANLAQRGEAVTSSPLPPQVAQLVARALDDLERHRRTDGVGTVQAMQVQLAEFESLCGTAATRAPQLALAYRERLLARVQEFVQSHLPEPPPAFDLVREVAIYADRVDVAEELQRLSAHLEEIRAVMNRGGELGRRLEFLLQELLRETNTLGSKSPDTTMAHTAVAMKTCIDRLKEQAANLE